MGNLKPQTKTILLHNGMQDNVDDFLIESPAVEYVENGVFDKDGVISKRNGFVELPDNERTEENNGAATVLVGGNRLVIPYAQGITVYSPTDGAWEATATPTVFTSNERVYGTQSAAGACHYHCVAIQDYLVIVYEVPGARDLDPTSSKVFLEIVGPDNTLLSRREYTGYYPQIAKPQSAETYLIFTHLSGSVGSESLKSRRVTPGTDTVSSVRTTSLDIAAFEHRISGQTLSNLDNRHFLNWGTDHANYKLRPTGTGAVVVYCEEVSTTVAPDILYHFISATSPTTAPTVSAQATLLTENPCHTAFYTVVRILDAYFTGATLNVLYSVYIPNDSTAPAPDSYRLNITNGSTTTTLEDWDGYRTPGVAPSNEQFTLPVYSNGSIAETDSYLWVAVSKVGFNYTGAVVTAGTDDPGLSELVVYTLADDLSGKSTRHHRYGWRLATTISAGSGDVVYGGLQQNLQRYSGVIGKGAANSTAWSPLAHNSPVTTILCKMSTSAVLPVSCVGVNRSIAVSPLSGATATTLPDCEFTDDAVRILCPIQHDAVVANFIKDSTYSSHIGSIHNLSLGSRSCEVWEVELSSIPRPTVVGEGVLFANGIPLWFDGTRFVENTPISRPEVLWVEGNAYAGALGPDPAPSDLVLVHSVYGVYSYTDGHGIVHRSAPSTLAYIPRDEPGGGTDSTDFTLYFTNPLSLLPSGEYLTLEVYLLTEDVYKCVATQSVEANDSSYVEISVRLATGNDTVVSPGRALYTEGGVLPADVVPYCSAFVMAAGRLVGITDNTKSTLVFSKTLETSVSPEFPAAFTFPLNPGTTVTGVAGLDDKLIVFAPDDIYVLYGQGPTNTGRGNAFAIMRLPTPVGCTDAASVVETPSGVMFRGRRGFYILGRDLSVTPIHGASDILQGRTVTAATVVTSRAEVRFLLSTTGTLLDEDGPTADSTRPPTPKYGNAGGSSPALVYNYEKAQWAVFTNYAGVSAALLNGEYCRLRSDFSVWREDDDTWSDPDGDNLLKIITPWIKLNGLQSYGRIWSATFLGRYLSTFVEDTAGDLDAGDITIKVAYDYEKDDTQTHVFEASEELQPELRDGVTVSADRLQIKVVPKRQKCSAIRFTIEETDTADADGLTYRPGQGFEIPAIELELGMKDTANKSLSAQRKK